MTRKVLLPLRLLGSGPVDMRTYDVEPATGSAAFMSTPVSRVVLSSSILYLPSGSRMWVQSIENLRSEPSVSQA